jgi:hypothetical protein
MSQRTSVLTSHAAVIIDRMTGEDVSESWHTSYADAQAALDAARAAGSVPPGGVTMVQTWEAVYRLSEAGDWVYTSVRRVS